MKGIPNQGQSCYIASVLQTALTSQVFNATLVRAANRNKPLLLQHQLFGAYCKIVNQVTNTNSKYIDLSPLRNALIQYSSSWAEQADCADLMIFICSKFEEVGEVNPLLYIERITNNRACNHNDSRNVSSSSVFMLTEPGMPIADAVLQSYNKGITDCLVCNAEQSTVITSRIVQLPQLMCVRTNGLLKELQIELTIANSTYQIVSLILYAGNGHYGHYWCVNRVQDRWFECNDDSIREVPDVRHLIPFNFLVIYDIKS